ncbi:hypothetical protein BDW74DRAFT_156661 [Aspergillus multicolor]|uniref:uncharacterized protein n=1 Tax=Aspergillus multicolor TaxID=41759 RepID=UPI003CCDA50B
MAEGLDANFGLTKSIAYLPNDPPIIVWTKLQARWSKTLDPEYRDELFQPLVHAVGHNETVWARGQDNPDVVFLVTLWWTTSELREFKASPSAQLYRESLQGEGITPLSTHETIYGSSNWFRGLQYSFMQIFWVYFPAPVDENLQSAVKEIVGIRPPALGFGVPQKQRRQTHLPAWQWATRPEVLHGKQVQLFLWPHFWRTEEQAEWRHNHYAQPRFIKRVEELGPVEWKEELYNRFTKIPKL